MAENSNAPSATAQAPAGESPTQIAPETTVTINSDFGAGLSSEFLAEIGLSVPVETKPSGDEATKAAADEVTEPEAEAEGEVAEVVAEDGEEEELKLEGFTPEVQKRLKTTSEQKKALREEVATLKEKAEAAEKALADSAANVPTILPPSPLAHLDTPEALEQESANVVAFMKAAKAPDFATKYADYDEETGTSATFEQNQAYALHFLEHQNAHAKTLATKKETREEVRKAYPALFDGKSDESKERIKLYASDPRTMADYDQFIADAIAGRNARLEKAKAPEAPPVKKTNGTTAKAKEAPPVYNLPHSRSPVTPSNVVTPREAIFAKARTGGVSIDDMMDAGVI